jgi:Uma2 family endonuclease
MMASDAVEGGRFPGKRSNRPMAQSITTATTAPAVERRLRMSYDEFLAWADEDVHAEWVDGEVTVFVPPIWDHQDIVSFLDRLVGLYAELFGLGRVVTAPFEMRLERSAREPDLLFVAGERARRMQGRTRLDGPADLVVELVSPESAIRDRRDKLAEYAAAGIPEYWVLDPRPGRQRADFFRLDEDGVYRSVPPDADGRYHSAALPGFWLRPAWLWQDPLPQVLPLLRSIVGPDVLLRALGEAGSPDHGG